MSEKTRVSATRGTGILENWLFKKRTKIAYSLIPECFRSGRILDVGCGKNPIFLRDSQFSEKYGLDQLDSIDDDEIAFKKYDVASSSQLPYEENYFDVVSLLAVLEHIHKDVAVPFIAEIYRILKPCGVFILTTPSPSANVILKIMSRINLVSKEEIDEHKATYYSYELKDLLKEGGFCEHNIEVGRFELFLNIWASARKM